jgi:hypothetical protein
MSKPAILWIRDGVLIERMHMNAVAFAFSYWLYADPIAREEINFTALVQFAFDRSGYSCADKIRLFNEERQPAVKDIEGASSYYNELAPRAGRYCRYFPGMVGLLEEVKAAGCLHFITSAVEQEVLDAWLKGTQAQEISHLLQESLGKRATISTGEKHFEYVHSNFGNPEMIMIADAPMEIKLCQGLADRFKIKTIAFANVITVDKVKEGMDLVTRTADELEGTDYPKMKPIPKFDKSILRLPDQRALEYNLQDAGADEVVSGDAESIVSELRSCFKCMGVLN